MGQRHFMITTTDKLKVLIASVIAVVVTVGIARFSYTPMIPEMVAGVGLSQTVVGLLATVNYAGYLTGALLISRISDMGLKVRLYQLGLLGAVVTTALMGFTTEAWLWYLLRFASGLSTSTGMLLGAGLLMSWLLKHNQKSELGIFFSGIGLGIVLTAVLAEVIRERFAWDEQWVIYGLAALVLLLPIWRWTPDYRACAMPRKTGDNSESDRSRFIFILQLAYFCAGVGYVVTATFLVAIAESMPALAGRGWQVWLVAGLAATPACWLWDVFTRRWGHWSALYLAYVLNAVSILMLVLDTSLASVMLSSLIYGASFIGIVSMVLAMVGRVYPENPSRPMSRLTFSYGIAQILAPAIVGYLADAEGNYTNGLLMTLVVMALGVVFVAAAHRHQGKAGAPALSG